VRMAIGTSKGLETRTTYARTLQRTARAPRPRLPFLGATLDSLAISTPEWTTDKRCE
jgi:hypothetical protein